MIESGRISLIQLFILMIIYLTASASVSNVDFLFAGQDAVFANLFAIPLGILTVFLMVQLQKRYPGKTLFEYSEEIMGRWLGKLVGVIYFYFCFEICTLICRFIGEFVVSILTPEISVNIYIGMMILVIAYGVYKGVEVIGRFAQLVFPFYVILLIFINVLLVGQFEAKNVLPLWDHKVGEIVYTSYLQYIFPLGEIIFFIGIIPYVKNAKKLFPTAVIAIVLAGIYLGYRSFITMGVLGSQASIVSTYPYFMAIRFVKIGEFIERIDLIGIGIFGMIILIQITILFDTMIRGFACIVETKNEKIFILPLGLLVFGMSTTALHAPIDITEYLTKIRMITSPIYMLLIPLLLLIISRIRHGKVPTNSVK